VVLLAVGDVGARGGEVARFEQHALDFILDLLDTRHAPREPLGDRAAH